MTKYYDQSGKEIPIENIDFGKLGLEIQRYKQDCRKRALDLANMEYSDWYRESNSKSASNAVGEKPNVISLADKYYNWLISIPDK